MILELEKINWNEELGNKHKDINVQWNFIKIQIASIKDEMEKTCPKKEN